MALDPRDNAERIEPAKDPALAGSLPSPDEERISAPGSTETFTPEDQLKFVRPAGQRPLTINEQATIREQPPRFAPPTVVLRPAWIWAGVFVVIPLLLWGLTLWTTSAPDDAGLRWAIAATAEDTGSVVLRSPADFPDLPPVAVTRRNSRLVALDPDTGSERWTFPPEVSGRLLGAGLDDAVLWIPVTGPFSPPDSETLPALFALWTNEESVSRKVRLSLLDREGKEVWTAPLDPGVTPDRFVWVAGAEGPLLVYDSPETPPQRFNLRAGKLPPREGTSAP